METVDSSMERDGEPVEGRGSGGGMNSSETRTVVRVDTVLESKDGAPTSLRREFETVSSSSSRTFRDREMENERECPLDGVVIEMILDDGEVTTEVVEGDTPDDDAVLEGHKLTLALDALLPEDEVEADDSWDIDGEALMHALGYDLEKALYPVPERTDDGGGEGRRGGGRGRRGGWGGGGGGAERFFTSGEWEAEATLESDTVEYEGIECHVISIEAEASGELPEREFGGRDRGDGQFELSSAEFAPENSFEFEIEGKLYFNVDGNHPVHLEIEGSLSTESVREMNWGDSEMVISSSQEGTLEYTIDISVVTLDEEGEE